VDDGVNDCGPPYGREMDTITRDVTARQLRGELATLVDEAAYGDGRIAQHRYGSLVAVLIGVEDVQKPRRLEEDPGARERETIDEWADRLAEERRLQREADVLAAAERGEAPPSPWQ
jgi:antitoxin (DNA-binding transcriptional repressor) of toxin-antitoxin stability system